jgi:hypothetical protein
MIDRVSLRALVTLVLLSFVGSSVLAKSIFYFPQTAVGVAGNQQIASYFTATNPYVATSTINVNFYDDGGGAWALDVTCDQQPALNGNHSTFGFSLAGGDTVTFAVRSSGGIAAGWTRITASSPVAFASGYLLGMSAPSNKWTPIWGAGVLAAPSGTQLVFALDVRANGVLNGIAPSTGFAVVNPSNASAQVQADLYDSTGALVQSKNFSLPSHGHLAQFLTELFNDVDLNGFVGRVDVSCNIALAAMVLQGASGGGTTIFSSVPVTSKTALRGNTFYEEESNNTFETSQQLSLDCEVLGTSISATGSTDADYFRFSLAAGDDLLVTLQTESVGSAMNPTVTLYDSAQQVVATGTALVTEGMDRLIAYHTAAGGVYYLKIEGSSGQQRFFYRATIAR